MAAHAAATAAAGRTRSAVNPRILAGIGWYLAVAAAIAGEGAFAADLPFSLLHLMVVALLPLPRVIGPVLLAVALAEWGLGTVPIGAALSTAAVVWLVLQWIADDVALESAPAAAVAVIGYDLVQQFWLGVFASLYRVHGVPPLPLAHMVIEAALAAALAQVLSRRRTRRAVMLRGLSW